MIDLKTPILTPRQKEIATLTANGYTMDQIAVELGISPRTVMQTNIEARERMGSRLGVEMVNATQMVAWAVKLGEIEVG